MKRIFYVEDEEALRDNVVELLEKEGHEVAVASNGQEGLAQLFRFRPHLVLSDCLMPAISGFDMVQAIRENHPEFAAMPIVLLSANVQELQIGRGMGLGAQRYLAKPVDSGARTELLYSLLDAPEPTRSETATDPTAGARRATGVE